MHSPHHPSRDFEGALRSLHGRLMEMGRTVEYQIRYAIETLHNRDVRLLQHVLAEELKINAMECEIDEACTQIIARRSPAAGDLRFLLCAYKMITQLERIGDEAKKIAIVGHPLRADRYRTARLARIREVGEQAVEMLRMTLDGLAELQTDAVSEVIAADARIDEASNMLLREALNDMIADPRSISASIDFIWVVKAVERIGDHARTIAGYLRYMVEGEYGAGALSEAIATETSVHGSSD